MTGTRPALLPRTLAAARRAALQPHTGGRGLHTNACAGGGKAWRDTRLRDRRRVHQDSGSAKANGNSVCLRA